MPALRRVLLGALPVLFHLPAQFGEGGHAVGPVAQIEVVDLLLGEIDEVGGVARRAHLAVALHGH